MAQLPLIIMRTCTDHPVTALIEANPAWMEALPSSNPQQPKLLITDIYVILAFQLSQNKQIRILNIFGSSMT